MGCGRPDKSGAIFFNKENGFIRDAGNRARRLILQMPENMPATGASTSEA